MHNIQLKIIKSLVFKNNAQFKDLKENLNDIDNNQFCFHLNKLIDNKYVSKNSDNLYSLTKKGSQFSEKLDTEEVSIKEQSKLTVYLGVTNDKDQVLIYTRKKNPFFNCQGFGGGRVNYGEDLLKAAKRELKEETGLEGEPELIKILHNKLYKKGTEELLVDKILFFFKIHNPTGDITCSEEGLYEWVDIKDLDKYIKQPFDSKDEFLKQVNYLLTWDGQIVLEEKDIQTDNY